MLTCLLFNLEISVVSLQIKIAHINISNHILVLTVSYNKADLNSLRSFFQLFPLESHCFYNNNINDAVSNFTETVLQGMNKFIPLSVSKLNSNSKIFSKEAAKAATQNKAAYKKYKRNKISCEKYQAISKN